MNKSKKVIAFFTIILGISWYSVAVSVIKRIDANTIQIRKIGHDLVEKQHSCNDKACPLNGIVFYGVDSLSDRLKITGVTDKGLFSCAHAGCTFTTSKKEYLRQHSFKHSHDKLKCRFFWCCYGTPHKRSLRLHEKRCWHKPKEEEQSNIIDLTPLDSYLGETNFQENNLYCRETLENSN